MSADAGWERSPFRDGEERFLAGRLGIRIFLASLSMLFAGSIIGFIVLRVSAEAWPDDLPPLPAWLGLSTLLLIATSVAMHAAVRAERTGRTTRLRRALLATIALAVAFLAVQTLSWWIWRGDLQAQFMNGEPQRFALSGFYVLTGVHALHVIGGLVPMAMLATRGGSPPSRGRVRFCAMYWHFLDVVWIILLAVLIIGV